MNPSRSCAPLGRLTLEVSLKPFRDVTDPELKAVCEALCGQWQHLAARADELGIQLFIGDGDEVFQWRGKLEDPVNWCNTTGCSNMPHGYNFVHRQAAEPYRNDPPEWTYADLKRLVAKLKETVGSWFGRKVHVGTIIDAGAEFVESDFKFRDHPEVMKNGKDLGLTGIFGAFMDCTARLRPDGYAYAAFPEGIPERGVSFGEFLGRQYRSLSQAVGFDYVWFSNGLGFTYTPWESKGELFDEERFHYAKFEKNNEATLGFWKDFTLHSGGMPIGLRGTNQSVGFDLSVFGVSMKDVYESAPICVTPPNPPWGNINPGLEMTVHLSRIAKTPTGRFGMRFYNNDPWFHAEPWFGYYAEEGYDILMPSKVTRLGADGRVENPVDLNIFTVDDDLGVMNPDQSLDVSVRFNRALCTLPDAPGAVTWIYPFDELDRLAKEKPKLLHTAYFHDMFVRDIVNQGFPLNTVAASETFINLVREQAPVLRDTILLAMVPEAGSALSEALLAAVAAGCRVLLYGPLDRADPKLTRWLGVELMNAALEGPLELTTAPGVHRFKEEADFHHRALTSGGGIRERWADPLKSEQVLEISAGGERRAYALMSREPGIELAWIRGSVGLIRNVLHTDFAEAHHIHALLARFGYRIRNRYAEPGRRSVVQFISRREGGYRVTGHKPDETTVAEYAFPEGAPLFLNTEAVVEQGFASYSLARTFDYELRVFVRQQERAVLCCKEEQIVSYIYKRACSIRGLKEAEVYFLPPAGTAMDRLIFRNLSDGTILTGTFDGRGYMVPGVSGVLEIMW